MYKSMTSLAKDYTVTIIEYVLSFRISNNWYEMMDFKIVICPT